MLIYGVCISDIEKVNNEKIEQFLAELSTLGYGAFQESFNDNKKCNDNDYSVADWLDDYESNGFCGLAAFLKDAIADVEDINVSCDDPNGVHYLGIGADVPWAFNEKTRELTAYAFEQILSKYISKVTDEVLTIRWWNVNDDFD